MKLKLAIILVIWVSACLKAQSNESLYIKYSFMNNHIIEVSDSGVSASRNYYVRRRFWKNLKRKKLFIPNDEVDSLALYRLELFLRLNECLANVKSVKEVPLRTPEFFYLHCSDYSDTILITDNSRNVIPRLAYSQYMLNELRVLLNNLIPDSYGQLKIKIIYKPKAQDIIESR